MNDIWTPLKLIAWTQGYFARAGVDAPRLTAEILLAHALGCDRLRLYLDFDKPLAEPELARFRLLVKRRAEGEPTAYLVGAREFYGRSFRSDPRALVPRPETELLVEAALEHLPPAEGLALDVCTGSGCVGVTLALERPAARVVACDISPDALALARENADRLGARLELFLGDLFAPVPADLRFHVIAANPPYVPSSEIPALARELHREPALALDGGEDGLAVARRLVSGALARLRPGGALVVEMHESHERALPSLCLAAGFATAETRRDLAGLPRIVVARAKE